MVPALVIAASPECSACERGNVVGLTSILDQGQFLVTTIRRSHMPHWLRLTQWLRKNPSAYLLTYFELPELQRQRDPSDTRENIYPTERSSLQEKSA